jgi:hypothetical protein
MTGTTDSFSLPSALEPNLDQTLSYWDGLKRGGNDIPFWDDVQLASQERRTRDLALIEVFENPLRFRLDMVGEDIMRRYGTVVTGKFLDEIEAKPPLDALADQCLASLQRRAPSYYRSSSLDAPSGAQRSGYARLVMPLWGNGRIQMLLCAADFGDS